MMKNTSKTAIRDDVSLLPSAEELERRLLYRDAAMLILDKPAGLGVHVTAHDKVALDQTFDDLRFGLPRAPGLAHRLDRETSGCLVLGRHRQALDTLGKMFAGQQVEKTYLAVVSGKPAQDTGIIDAPILKIGKGSRWEIILDPKGQESITHYKLLASDGEFSLIEFSPKTGRTHQIRVHSSKGIGCPVVGDRKYGGNLDYPLQLHAWKISLPYYKNKPPVAAVAPVPQHMQALVARLDRSVLS